QADLWQKPREMSGADVAAVWHSSTGRSLRPVIEQLSLFGDHELRPECPLRQISRHGAAPPLRIGVSNLLRVMNWRSHDRKGRATIRSLKSHLLRKRF